MAVAIDDLTSPEIIEPREAHVTEDAGFAEAARRAPAELMYTRAWLAEHPGPHQTMGNPDMPDHARRLHPRAADS